MAGLTPERRAAFVDHQAYVARSEPDAVSCNACGSDWPCDAALARDALDAAEAKVIDIPVIPYPGGSTQADFYRSAAQHVLGGYVVGGSNLSRAVGTLLHSVADRLEAEVPRG